MTRSFPSRFALAFAPISILACAHGQTAKSCNALASLSIPHTTIVSAASVAAGAFVPPQPVHAAPFKRLPEFCRVVAKSAPTTDSDIMIEVWLPASGWNGKLRGQGNGGFAGQISYDLLALSVSQGYATAGTDTGHEGESTDASWALGHPEKVVDFGNRAIHEMTVTAKAVVDAFYGKGPEHAYFAACSDGGREALMEAQRFPDDYDGILAGAPAYSWINLVAAGMQKVKTLTRDAASYIPPSKIPAIAAAVNAACDAEDGVKDGIVSDPRRCNFKPESLLCKGVASDACLTPPQVESLKTLYAPVLNAAGKQIYPGTLPGAEDGGGGWSLWLLGTTPEKTLSYAFTTGFFKDMVYSNPQWDYKSFNLEGALKLAVTKTAGPINATDPNLQRFARHGGKLILYHGWNDPAISPLSTLDYYQRVQQINANAASFVRLFMVPGMQHCAGGPGPSSFGQFGYQPGTGPDDPQHDLYLGLEQWVEKGTAPEQVIAARFETKGNTAPILDMTRPLCAYPLVAKYKGSGATTGARNFTCTKE